MSEHATGLDIAYVDEPGGVRIVQCMTGQIFQGRRGRGALSRCHRACGRSCMVSNGVDRIWDLPADARRGRGRRCNGENHPIKHR